MEAYLREVQDLTFTGSCQTVGVEGSASADHAFAQRADINRLAGPHPGDSLPEGVERQGAASRFNDSARTLLWAFLITYLGSLDNSFVYPVS